MKIYQSRSLANKVKKLSKPEKTTLDKENKKILSNPEIGVEKKGGLRGIFVHKFKIKSKQHLLSLRSPPTPL